jgi:thymidylate synthase (FAD)
MRVVLMEHTPQPEKVVAAAARLCYSESSGVELYEGLTEEKAQSFIHMLMNMGHESPLEHVSFTFSIEGVSRNLSHQLVRHRIASYSQKSQRYVNESHFDYIIPPTILKDGQAKAVFEETMLKVQEAYEVLKEIVPKEDARYVLPGACETKLVATFNARSLLNFFQHRSCQRAQWEIRALAKEMLKQAKAVAPILFAKAGPTCVTEDICYEGKLSCGRIAQIKNRN